MMNIRMRRRIPVTQRWGAIVLSMFAKWCKAGFISDSIFPLSVWRWIAFHFDSTLPKQTKSECSTEAWPHALLEIQWWVTLMSNIYIHTHTLRIWTILSLHESTHLIGTKSIQIRIGKRMRQRKKNQRKEDGTDLLTIPDSQDVFKMKIPLVSFSSFKLSSHAKFYCLRIEIQGGLWFFLIMLA